MLRTIAYKAMKLSRMRLVDADDVSDKFRHLQEELDNARENLSAAERRTEEDREEALIAYEEKERELRKSQEECAQLRRVMTERSTQSELMHKSLLKQDEVISNLRKEISAYALMEASLADARADLEKCSKSLAYQKTCNDNLVKNHEVEMGTIKTQLEHSLAARESLRESMYAAEAACDKIEARDAKTISDLRSQVAAMQARIDAVGEPG